MTNEIQSALETLGLLGECANQPKTYLGDGVYAFYDGFSIILATRRNNGVHWLALEPAALLQLEHFEREIEEINNPPSANL